MPLQKSNFEAIIDKYDHVFDLYKSYKDRLIVIFKEIFNKTDIQINAISGDVMSRSELKKRLRERKFEYRKLEDVEDLIKS